MPMTYVIHILAGSLALVFGYVALYSQKGAVVHRRSGMVFVYAMLTMSVFGALIAMVQAEAPKLNVPVALLTFYLVVTGLTTMRPPFAGSQWLNIGALLLVLGVALAYVTFGFQAIGDIERADGIAAPLFFTFAAVALLAAAGDVRMLRSGALKGASRLARHLWRMCFALLIAALSFFIGQAGVFPKPVRIIPLLALPVLAVLATMLYWLWRILIRRRLHGLVLSRSQRPAPF